MKIYAVTYSDYDEYSVYGIFSTKKKAEVELEIIKNHRDNFNFDYGYNIEEWELDKGYYDNE